MERRGYDLSECLSAMDPSGLSYEEWVSVGMALHAEGHACEEWDAWSRRDAARYHPGECGAKWRSFGSSPVEVTGGTIVQMARDRGWEPKGWANDPGEALSWDMTEVSDDMDPAWIESVEVSEPADGAWDGAKDLIDYLNALFKPSEVVGYVTDAQWQEDKEKWIPKSRGTYTMTAGEIIERLAKYEGDMAAAIGQPNEEAGAWIRFNPLDGSGVKNENVTELRYALVESDKVDIDKQRGIIDEMELPVAALVHSGNKSLHAIVRVDARDLDEYRKRVDYLYKACERYGLQLDTQNKNPSRLSRMPGVWRSGQKQFLVATDIGHRTWDEWKEWIEEIHDDLPDITEDDDLDAVEENPEQLIENVLFPGDKMLLAGPSKAGKSYLLIELCVAMASGGEWLGHRCKEGKILYINLELKKDNRRRRFKEVRDAMGADHDLVKRNIHYLDLRGKSAPLEQLSNSIIRRACAHRYQAIVIDPIYKVMMGDENSAEAVSKFCNQLDKLAEALGAAILYCHHHSKGSQGQKQSQDRASGSGVFTRDADVQLDMIELELSDAIVKQQENDAVCKACADVLDTLGIAWREHIPYDDQVMESRMVKAARERTRPLGSREPDERLTRAIEAARAAARAQSAWRIEGTFRELPRTNPTNVWFDWPVHRKDESKVLEDLKSNGQRSRKQKGESSRKSQAKKEETPEELAERLQDAYDACNTGDGVSVMDIANFIGRAEKTVRRYIKASERFDIERGRVFPNTKQARDKGTGTRKPSECPVVP